MRTTHLSRTTLLLAMLMIGCTANSIQSLPISATLVPSHELPRFSDDLDLTYLSTAIQRQLAVLRKTDDREVLRIGDESYRTKKLLVSLERFNALLSETEKCITTGGLTTYCSDAFRKKIRDQFLVYRLKPALLTAYYTPTIEVSKQRTEKFRYPIYRTPDIDYEQRYSREEIDFSGKLEGRGYELYYAADRFDLYIMHIEGGARVLVNDNGQTYTKYLHYNADNGQEFTNLHDYMVNHGFLESTKWSRWDQRAALIAHPEMVSEIFASCPGYVFFKVSNTPIISHTGVQLTENRSMATDPAYYPVKGIITYVVAPLPLPPAEGTPTESNPSAVKYRTMHRFFIDQDIGNNILGPARADLFFGEGPYPEFLSNNFMTKGIIYLLISK